MLSSVKARLVNGTVIPVRSDTGFLTESVPRDYDGHPGRRNPVYSYFNGLQLYSEDCEHFIA